jgi:FkbM family methyltransferase
MSLFRRVFILIRGHSIYKIKKLLKSKLIDRVPPYSYLEEITIKEIHTYLRIERHELESWCIVGGKLGNEIPEILKNFSNLRMTVFECSERYLGRLTNRFLDEDRVCVVGKAVADFTGVSDFYETTLEGSGSLLQLSSLHMDLFGSATAETFQVPTVTLDSYFGVKTCLDMLWIDVQGAEMKVLKGASGLLNRTSSVFIEVSVQPNLYNGSPSFEEIHSFLTSKNFHLAGLGMDCNLTGNALYIRQPILNNI